MNSIKANPPLSAQAPAVKVESQSFDLSAIANEVGLARKALGQDKFKAENPGMWQKTKEVFSAGAKKDRLDRIQSAEAMDKLLDQLMALVGKATKAMFGE